MKIKRISVLLTLMLAIGTFFSSLAFAEVQPQKNLVALGDSVTYGWHLAQYQPQPSTLAFPYLIESDHYTVTKDISYPGWTSKQLLDAIQIPENLKAIKKANVVTVEIGYNDFFQTPEIAALLKNPSGPWTSDQVNAAKNAALKTAGNLGINLFAIIETIKQVNPKATIILYNLFDAFASGTPLNMFAEQIIPTVNQLVITSVANTTGANVADAYTAFNGHQTEYILPNDVHPNIKGHQILAGLANDILENLQQ
ncbi:SGNH/GDSL hydrolase family protein [Bacillus sp. BRMEA1]|uniref:SGNH/GDSL hydrolase family protein n=1 Tax=Neobacillus endophyticus TaxID=2738405 RepID=UPI00156657AA|nr:SGNH/GDSL hydrolase family protein [Neobacillus endophyticus]NRD77354.1 SGNH/GDSL hydrolase family protein [Neobacillus endophyticus]